LFILKSKLKIALYGLLYIFILLVPALAIASGSSIRFDHLTIENGLPQNSAQCVIRDKQGFIWIGTQEGLVRYDGYDTRIFKHNGEDVNSLSANDISSIVEDEEGNLWIGTINGGLNLFNTKTEQFKHYLHDDNAPNSLSHDDVTTLTLDRKGYLWVGTRGGGLNRYNLKTEEFIYYKFKANNSNSLSDDDVWAITEDRKGKIWIGTKRGLNKFDPITEQFIHYKNDKKYSNSLSHDDVRAISEDAQGSLWIGTRGGGLNRLNPKTGQFIHYRSEANLNSLSHDDVRVITEDHRGDLWIGTGGGGLNRYNFKTGLFNHYRYDSSNLNSLSGDRIHEITPDEQGNLWIGTAGGGLNRFNLNSEKLQHYEHKAEVSNSLSANNIYSIAEGINSYIWIGIDGGGLNRFNPKTDEFKHYTHDDSNPNSLSDGGVFAVTQGNKGHLWIGTDGGGLNRFNPKTDIFKHYYHDVSDSNSLSHNKVYAIIEDSEENLWVGTRGGGLNHFNPETEIFTHYRHNKADANSLSDDYIFTIFEGSQGNIWIGTFGGGLNRFNPRTNKFHHYRYGSRNINSLSGDVVLTITEDKLENLWIGTSSGLNLFDKKTGGFTRFQVKDGLPNNIIYSIEEEDDWLWLSTNKGLTRFHPDSGKIKNYDVGDGLQSNEFNLEASLKSKNGELYFGGINGFNRFFPKDIKPNTKPPIVVFTDMLLSNQSVVVGKRDVSAFTPLESTEYPPSDSFTLDEAIYVTQEITLTHEQNLVTFEFSTLHFTNPKKNQYAYKMKGLDDDWINTDYKNRRATYTNLPSGNYTLLVKASNPDGVWNEQGVSLKINVLPPPWKSWWAYLIYGAICIIIFILLLKAQRQKTNRAIALSHELEKKVTERTADVQKLSEIGKDISSSLQLDNIIQDVYRHVNQLMDAPVFGIGILKADNGMIEFDFSIEDDQRLAPYSRSMNDKSQLAVECIATQKLIHIDDFQTNQAYQKYFSNLYVSDKSFNGDDLVKKSPQSLIYIPLNVGDEILGVLAVHSYKPNAYDEHHIDVLQSIASYAVIAIKNAKGYTELKEALDELKGTQQQLIQSSKMASLGTMTAGVAHEINNPTNFAYAAVYMMKDEIKEIKLFLKQLAGGDNADPEVLTAFDDKFTKLIELIQTATEGTNRIKIIVEDLRTFARLDDAKKATVQLSSLLTSTTHLVRTQYDRLEIETQLNVDPEITCFPSKLNQVFMNIIVNACQAIVTKQENDKNFTGRIIITTSEQDNQLVVMFKDNGCGMDEATQQRVFEPFYTTKDVGTGTGLGMAISFGIIEEHSGLIAINSVKDKGSEITIRLPY